ncbi:pentapeptide repeat-containing protein [Neorhodopirellula lusitana]|uniref:pentapeptide repeat-containing protein n=1 Tax=Neorhodopirellula lusitana TaxID=445327 RepID=UPI00384BE606
MFPPKRKPRSHIPVELARATSLRSRTETWPFAWPSRPMPQRLAAEAVAAETQTVCGPRWRASPSEHQTASWGQASPRQRSQPILVPSQQHRPRSLPACDMARHQHLPNQHIGCPNTGSLNIGCLNAGFQNTGFQNTGLLKFGLRKTGRLNTGCS